MGFIIGGYGACNEYFTGWWLSFKSPVTMIRACSQKLHFASVSNVSCGKHFMKKSFAHWYIFMQTKLIFRWKGFARRLLILVLRAHDPSGLRQGSTALAGHDFLTTRRVFVSYSQPIRFFRFEGKSVNRRLPVLDQARALDPCCRPEGSWALGTRMGDWYVWNKGVR